MTRPGVASRIKIWRHSNLPATPIPIDPTGPTHPTTGQLLGYATKRILIKAATANTAHIYVWDQSQSPGMYWHMWAGWTLELNIDSSNLVLLSANTPNQGVSVIMELQTGAT